MTEESQFYSLIKCHNYWLYNEALGQKNTHTLTNITVAHVWAGRLFVLVFVDSSFNEQTGWD